MSSRPARSAKVRMLSPLADQDFRTLWVAMLASLLGDGVFLVAIAWQVYTLSNAPAALAVVGIATTLPQVVLLLAGGVISDHFDRRRVMIGADLVRGIVIGTLGVLTLCGTVTLAGMVALVVVYGAATAFFGPAFDALVPQIVPAARLTEANALDQFVRPAALRLAGPALGGVLVAALGAGYGFLFDAATFAISALSLSRIATRARVEAAEPDEALSVRAVMRGLRFIRGHVWLWGTFFGATISYLLFIGPSEVLLPFVIKDQMHDGARVLGLVFGAGGIGALLAAAITGQRGMPRRHLTWMYVSWAVGTLALAGYGLATTSWQLALACFVFNGLEAAGTVWWATMKGRLVPAELLGRVSSFDWFISTALVPVSYALTPLVAGAMGVRGTLVWVGVVGGVTTLLPLRLRGMLDVERAGLARDDACGLASVRGGPAAAETG